MKLLLTAFFAFFTLQAHAVPVAIVDSGVDFDHPDLKPYAWVNPGDRDVDGADNDHNGMTDDVHGWNMAENNNKLIEKSLLGTFSKDAYNFFEVQLRVIRGEGTPEQLKADKEWMKSKKDDKNFIAELQVFGNFIHGTHVAGIASKAAPHNEIMGIKLLPTGNKKPKTQSEVLAWAEKYNFNVAEVVSALKINPDSKLVDFLIKKGLGALASAQAEMLVPTGRYLRLSGAKVANCSFGTSPHVIQMLLNTLFQALFKKDVSKEKLHEYSVYFMNHLLDEAGRKFAVKAKQTLFVIAAGNDGSDNDDLPTYPANVKRFNTITVAATQDYDKLAVFSNYGKSTVEIAAPGVGIRSTVPGGQYLAFSGTSQASPHVANIAGQVLNENPALTPEEVKTILMGTVDVKSFLKDKVVSGGTANGGRAVYAANLSRSMSIDQAIKSAKVKVADIMLEKPVAPVIAPRKADPMPEGLLF